MSLGFIGTKRWQASFKVGRGRNSLGIHLVWCEIDPILEIGLWGTTMLKDPFSVVLYADVARFVACDLISQNQPIGPGKEAGLKGASGR